MWVSTGLAEEEPRQAGSSNSRLRDAHTIEIDSTFFETSYDSDETSLERCFFENLGNCRPSGWRLGKPLGRMGYVTLILTICETIEERHHSTDPTARHHPRCS